MNRDSNHFSSDEQFARKMGEFMLQWEKQRGIEIERHVFLLTPEVEARLERIKKYVFAAREKPVTFRWEFDPIYNQINITLEDYIFSNGVLDLRAILGEADTFCIDALEDGRLSLEIGIHHAAYELEK